MNKVCSAKLAVIILYPKSASGIIVLFAPKYRKLIKVKYKVKMPQKITCVLNQV